MHSKHQIVITSMTKISNHFMADHCFKLTNKQEANKNLLNIKRKYKLCHKKEYLSFTAKSTIGTMLGGGLLQFNSNFLLS